jgi:hypothetical protein
MALNFEIDSAHGDWAFFLSFQPNLLQNARGLAEIRQIFFNTHDDGLRLASLVDDEALIVLPNAPENLSKLRACSQGWDNSQDLSGFTCFHRISLGYSPYERTN